MGGRERRSSSIAFRIESARTAISAPVAGGLATVSIKAEVSPKSLLNWIGPAPCGRRLLMAIELKIYIAELLLGVLDAVIQLDVDQRKSGKTEGADAEVGGGRRPNKRILRHRLFNRPADQLLYLLRGRSRPLRAGDRHPNRDAGILALRHFLKAVPAPDKDANQQDQGNLAVLGKETRRVVRMLDQVGFGFMSHERLRTRISEKLLRDDANHIPVFHQADAGRDYLFPGGDPAGNCDNVAESISKFHRA